MKLPLLLSSALLLCAFQCEECDEPVVVPEMVVQVIDPCFPEGNHISRLPLEIFAEQVDSCSQIKYDFDPYQTDENGLVHLPKGQYNHFYVEDDWGPVVGCDLEMTQDTVRIELVCPH